MNREERRKRRRQQMRDMKHRQKQPAYKSMTKEQKMDALIKNGITPKDLKKSYSDGYNAGFSDACPATFKTIYAAVCLALNEMHGFGAKRCRDVLKMVDEKVLYSLTSEEAIQAVYDRMELTLDFNEPFERIAEKD